MPQTDDQRLQNDVCDALCNSSYHELRDVTVQVSEGGVRLRGLTRSYHMKQVAQSLIKKVSGVHLIENNISVFDIVPLGASALDE